MKRTVILSERSALWEKGDAARSIGLVEKGKLGVMSDQGLIGVLWPGMVFGESAILTLEGQTHTRTASVFALEDDTTVTEYSIFLIREALELGNSSLAEQSLSTLVGQTFRNFYLVLGANQERPIIKQPIEALMQALMQTYKDEARTPSNWEQFLLIFKYLYHLRDYSEAVRGELAPKAEKHDVIQASQTARELMHPEDSLPIVHAYLDAEQERGALFEQLTPTNYQSARIEAKRIPGSKTDSTRHRFVE